MASFTVPCPQCRKRLKVPSELLGRWIKCPECGAQFSAMLDEPDDSSAEQGGAAELPQRMPAGTKFGLALVVGLVVLTFVGILVTVAVSRRPAQQAQQPARPQAPTSPAPQPPQPRTAAEGPAVDTGAVAGVAFWLGCCVVLPLLHLVATVLLLAWVARDARARGVDGGAVWVLIILFTSWLGLLVYLASRPHGVLVVCKRCNNKRLEAARTCPHCGRR